ncbi:GNAT family N-acetyltransferase [Maribacter sp. X9]|uniref:GNAT family N-acetyltransferase n=1 Tax=Maribacter sp. X9 TaxID=3402159 RepID=UPI003AF370C0
MNGTVLFEPLTPNLYDDYIKIGTIAYNQHYLHLWPNGDTSTYIESSFTKEVLLQEEQDDNTVLYLIKTNKSYVGLLKIILHKSIANYKAIESLYIDKIYIQKEFTGIGLGRKTLEFVTGLSKKLSKKAIYLETMQKGPALPFYLAHGFHIIDMTKVPFANAVEEEKPMYVLLKEI